MDVSSGNVFVGTPVTLSTTFAEAGVPSIPSSPPSCVIVDAAGNESTYTGEVVNPSTGVYQLSIITSIKGIWHWRWIINGQATDEGFFTVETDFDQTLLAPDLTSLRVLIPRARRVCEGPYGAPQGKPTLLDSQLYAMLADACGDMILFTGSLFHHELIATERDPLQGYPTEWGTKRMLNEWEGALIATQTALNYFLFVLRDLKMSETVKNEGTEYTWSLSANVLGAYLKELQSRRDLAIEGLRFHHPIMDRFASNIRVRDQATVAILEWWDHNSPGLSGAGIPGGQEAAIVPWTPGWSGPGFVMGY